MIDDLLGSTEKTLDGQTISAVELCDHLGIRPLLKPGEEAVWLQWDDPTGTGINALLACYDREIDDEPYDYTLAVYTMFRNDAGQPERDLVATLDFCFARDGQQNTDDAGTDPVDRPYVVGTDANAFNLVVVENDVQAGLQERSLQEALAEVNQILTPYAMQRTARF